MRPSPIVVSTGVISKRSATFETNQIPFEFKINISDSEVVIVENPSCLNSFAVILKGTAILAYRPQMQSKPFSCQLNRVELFSSILSLEEETALSIVDPATISIEIVGKTSGSDTQGILEATSVQQVLEIQAQHLVFRLSYNDMKLFVRILDSLPRQVSSAHLSLLHLIYFYFINPFFCKCNFLCCMPCLVYVVVGMEPVNILTSHNLFQNCAHHFVMIGSDVLFIVLFVMGIQQFRELKDFWLQNCFRKRRK